MTLRQHRILKVAKQQLLHEYERDSSKSIYEHILLTLTCGTAGLYKRDTDDVIAVELNALDAQNFLKVIKYKDGTLSSMGIQITKQGAIAESDFWRDTIILWVKNIFIPAVVSIVVSIVVNALIS